MGAVWLGGVAESVRVERLILEKQELAQLQSICPACLKPWVQSLALHACKNDPREEEGWRGRGAHAVPNDSEVITRTQWLIYSEPSN